MKPTLVKRLILFIGLACCIASPALAQETCSDDETIKDCWFRFFKNDEAATAKKNLEEKETGLDISGSDLGSTVKNFLPVLSVSGLAGDALTDNQNGTYTLDLTPFSALPKSQQYGNLKLEAVFNTEPTIFDTLKASLPETIREERAKALIDDLNDLDDVSLAFSYNYVRKNLGRNFYTYRMRYSSLFEAARDKVQLDVNFGYLKVLQAIQNELGDTSAENLPFNQIRDESQRQRLKAAVAEAARAEATFEANMQQQIDQAGLKSFADLINNQPQLHLTIDHHFRDDLVGPNETSAKVTYEMGFVNVNTFEKEHGRTCDDGARRYPDAPSEIEAARAAAAAACLEAYRTFLADNKERLQEGERLAFSVGYSRTNEYTFSSPQDSVNLMIPKAGKLLLEAGYGRLLSVRRDEPGNTRIDLTARLELATNDKGGLLNDTRYVVSLMLTEKVGKVSIPFGLVFANKDEFLGDVDHQINAHLGLKLNLFAQ